MAVLSHLLLIAAAGMVPLLALESIESTERPLKCGDLIRITISGVPAADQQSMSAKFYVVSNSGHIRLQHLKSDVPATGLTVSQLARRIESIYKSEGIYTAPVVAVTRHLYAGKPLYYTVIIAGKVKDPGSMILTPRVRILDAIWDRGGFVEGADLKQVRLVRKNTSRVLDLSRVGSSTANLLMEAGDIIIVPEAKPDPKSR